MSSTNEPVSQGGVPGRGYPGSDGPITIDPVPSAAAVTSTLETDQAVPKERFSPERLATEAARLDKLIAGLVVVLAFFLGSFAAQNTDLWMHLATGRAVVDGGYRFGADPFTYSAAGADLVNHSWLADTAAYFLANLFGGPDAPEGGAALVVLKAAVIALLAGVLLLTRRLGQGLWVASGMAVLAVLAASPRMLLQPSCLSYLFLALTLYLLSRAEEGKRGLLWVLPVLFAVWVNVDGWFVLGPLALALYLAGAVLQKVVPGSAPSEGAPVPTLALVLAVGLAACLLNPFTYRAFALPQDVTVLLGENSLAEIDPIFKVYSPFGREYLGSGGEGWSPAGVSFFLLALASFASFEVARTSAGLRWWRVLVWLVFLVPALFSVRMIPFFAIVAGPIGALNFNDFVRAWSATGHRAPGAWLLFGRIGTVAAGILLLVLAWPGMLHGGWDSAAQSRRVDWRVEVNPSFRQAALAIAELRQQGVFGDGHGFNFAPDIANYLAWYAPDEKSFYDYRLRSAPEVTAPLVEVNKSFTALIHQVDLADPNAWRAIFRDEPNRVDHIILSGQSSRRVYLPVVTWLWRNRAEWTPLYFDGRTTVFGWNDPARPALGKRFAKHRIDLNELAFGRPAEDQKAPEAGPEIPEERTFADLFWKGPAPMSLAADQARTLAGLWYDAMQSWPQYFLSTRRLLTTAVPLGSSPTVLAPAMAAYLSYYPEANIVRLMDPSLPAPLVLAVRASRRAVKDSPEDAYSYMALAETYSNLWANQERRWAGQSEQLRMLRQVQIVSALNRAARLRPDEPLVHERLAQVFGQEKWVDLELEHLRLFVEGIQKRGPVQEQSPEKFNEGVQELEAKLQQREQEVDLQRRRNDYEVASNGKPVLVRAKLAIRQGLVQQALDVLLKADPTQLDSEGVNLLVQLLAMTGRGDEALKEGVKGYTEWWNILTAAGAGDYGKVDHLFTEMFKRADQEVNGMVYLIQDQTFSTGVGPRRLFQMSQLITDQLIWAEYRTLQGLMALEQGETHKAAECFRRALQIGMPVAQVQVTSSLLCANSAWESAALWNGVAHSRTGLGLGYFPGRPIAARYLKLLSEYGN